MVLQKYLEFCSETCQSKLVEYLVKDIDEELKIPCTWNRKSRQMSYWFSVPQNSEDYDMKEKLQKLLKKFDPREETRKGIVGWKRQFSMCNCNVPKLLMSGIDNKEVGCDVVFNE